MGEGVHTGAGRLDGSSVDPVDAATVLLLRDGPGGPEVLLLERHRASDFAGGALVFPGGKVDEIDRRLADDRWVGTEPVRWVSRLGASDERTALGLLVAAVRETFEEAGVLLAHRSDGSPVNADELASPEFATERAKLAARGQPHDWRPFLAEQDLVLDLGALVLWSWWVTPEGQHKRFDTRFFAARVPVDQLAAHDEVETTSTRWMRPRDALLAHDEGTALVLYPTRHNLRDLATFPSVAAVWEAAAADRLDVRCVRPTGTLVDGRYLVQHPFGGEPEPI